MWARGHREWQSSAFSEVLLWDVSSQSSPIRKLWEWKEQLVGISLNWGDRIGIGGSRALTFGRDSEGSHAYSGAKSWMCRLCGIGVALFVCPFDSWIYSRAIEGVRGRVHICMFS